MTANPHLNLNHHPLASQAEPHFAPSSQGEPQATPSCQGEPYVVPACQDTQHEQQNLAAVLENVCLAYGGQEALHRIDLTVKRGTTTAIVGPNGSGKTSLLRILAGFIPPTIGTVCWHDGENIAMAEQSVSTDFWMPLRVKDVLTMGRYASTGAFRRLSRQDRDIVAEAAQRMAVDDLLSRQIGELSVGQRRRVRLAMCLAQQADLLLLDEPESGLDISSHQRIFAEISKEKQRGAAVVFTTHTLSEAVRSDFVLLLNCGMVAQGVAAEVLQEDNLMRAFGPVGVFNGGLPDLNNSQPGNNGAQPSGSNSNPSGNDSNPSGSNSDPNVNSNLLSS